VFKDSLLFPFALSLIGLAIIWLGVLWQRREAELTTRMRALLPSAVRELLEARAVR
jgi:spore maturation protein SpmA